MPWKCPVCGYDNPDDAEYCMRCGTAKPSTLVPPTSTQPSSTVTQPETQAQPQNAQQLQQVPTPDQSQQAPQAAPETVAQQPQPQQPALQQTPQPATAQESQVQTAPQQVQAIQVPQPAGKFYLQFIQTPASQLNNLKLPLDFETFPNISIGRSPENVIVVPDPEVSRRHAVLSLENNELYIEDLNSTNGTYIYDGKMFQPVKGKVKLALPAVIKLGNQTIIKLSRE